MRSRAMEGTCLAELVELAMPICQRAEPQCPKTGPGRNPDFANWQIALLILVAVARGKKAKSAQYIFLSEHQAELVPLLSLERFPARSTYYDRYRGAHRFLAEVIRLHGELAVRYGWAEADVVAVDKSVIAARGRIRHKMQRKKQSPRGIDHEAGWGRNEHDGWVYGYGYEVVVSCGNNGVLWPLQASANRANFSESMSLRAKIPHLPNTTRFVLADRGYDADDNCEAIEWTPDHTRTGRRFVCPTIERYNARRQRRQVWKESKERKRRRAHRESRKAFLRTPRGRRLYAKRGQTVEPFNSWFKNLFDLQDRVWHRGRDNNQTQLLAALAGYQLLLRINRRRKNNDGRIKWILDAL